jgi:hypothetical protein
MLKGTLPKAAIIAFCLWHMFAVAIYSIPTSAPSKLSAAVRDTFVPIVMPYVLVTSQWQKWNLFSPDPLRRVTTYVLETEGQFGTWNTVAKFSGDTLPWWKRSDELKILGNLQEGGARLEAMRIAYLRSRCAEFGLSQGAPVRLMYEQFVLPVPPKPTPPGYWRTVQLNTERNVDVTTTCP